MRTITLFIAAIGLFAGSVEGATLFLALDGEGTVDLAPGESVEISILLEISVIDAGFAYAAVFLDDNDDQAAGPLSVTELEAGWEGPDIVFDRSAFVLPADTSEDQENEYGLVMGRQDGEDWGPGTYWLDTLIITHDGDETSGTIEITFESAARSPQIFTADFTQYIVNCDLCCDWPPCSNLLDLGVGAEDNPFIVNLTPGPPCDGDANGDGVVDPLDVGFVQSRFGCEVDSEDADCDAADQNGDDIVDPLDVGFVLGRFGQCP